MKNFFERTLKIYDRERRPFLFTVSFFFLIFLFMAIFRSYVDATFLKRYGAEEIPLMMLVNGVLTVLFFWFVGVFFKKLVDYSLVAWFMILCALLTGILFFMVLRGVRLAYPLLYQLLNLQDSFFLVYLWNIASDLFDARQGKRIFPLIMAGQVLGTTMGSFMVAPLAGIAGYDSLLIIVSLAYLLIGISLISTASLFVSAAGPCGRTSEGTSKRPAEVISLIKGYPIIRYLIANAFFPNLLLPVFTYQFSLVAQKAFQSEQALLTFLGVFRGATTMIIFFLLFAMGRFYVKIGLAKASFLHPLNFAVVFTGLAVSLNIFIAAYGQFSIIFIQRAIAGPINKVLFNMIPERITKWSRVFISGTVIKTAMIISALVMVLLQKLYPAHDMAFIAAVLALWWLYETYLFKKRFTGGLKQALKDRTIDYDLIEAGPTMTHDVPYMEVGARISYEEKNGGRIDHDLSSNPEMALRLLDAPHADIRAQAAVSFAGNQDVRALNLLVGRLNDVESVHRAAIDALASYGNQFEPFFETALINAPMRVKQGIMEVLKLSGKREIPFSFVHHEIMKTYQNIEIMQAIGDETPSASMDMLKTHLREDNKDSLRLIFSALMIHLSDMRLVFESLHTGKAAVAVELLEATLHPEVARFLVPLIDNISPAERIEKGRDLTILRHPLSMKHTLSFLGKSLDPTTRMLTAFVIGENAPESFFYPTVERLLDDPEENVRQTAAYAMKKIKKGNAYMPEIILNMDILKKTTLFDGVSVRAMEAIASVVKQRFYKRGDVVIKGGEEVFSLYCIINGEIDVLCRYGQGDQQVIRTLADGAIIGELPLFTGHTAKETYVVASDFIEFYTINHEYIRDLMNIYPKIAINMGRFFALQLEGL